MADKLPIVLRTSTLGSEELRDSDNLSVGDGRIVDVADPVDGTDAVNLDYLTAHSATTEHGSLLYLLNNDHPQYVLKSEFDHGSLLGLADDDHVQYHNDARAVTWYETNYYVIPAGTPDPLGATGHWLLAWDDGGSAVEWFWSYEIPDFSGATEKDVLRITAINTLEWAARGVDLVSTYMLFANASTEIAGTDKLVFDGTDFTLATGSSLRAVDILVCAPGGTGAFQTSSVGDARGTYVIDLQIDRANVAMVASGANSVLLGGNDNTVAAASSVICGGHDNGIAATGDFSSIVGGEDNDISGASTHCFIGGGDDNAIVASTHSVIVGGHNHDIPTGCGNYNFIGGGDSNVLLSGITYDGYSTIVGGDGNSLQGIACFIGGGKANDIILADGVQYSTIGGGWLNVVAADYCFIGGGYSHSIAATCSDSVICGGTDHTIAGTSTNAFIGGGYTNSITNSTDSVIVGGDTNVIPTGCGTHNFIGGGNSNTLITGATYNGYNVFVGGDDGNIQGTCCFIGGGENNGIVLAAGVRHGVVVGGYENSIASDWAFIGGGFDNDIAATADYAAIVGGDNNDISGASTHCFIGGGDTNTIVSSTDSVIVGGDTNAIPTGCGTHNFIGGGNLNLLVAAATNNGTNVIVGGINNSIQGQYCFISGGNNNDITLAAGAQYSSIVGGTGNLITNSNVNIVGNSNTISASFGLAIGTSNTCSTNTHNIAIGTSNLVTGQAGIAIGVSNQATGNYSFAVGTYAKANNYGQMAISSGAVAAAGDRQRSFAVTRRNTTNATPSILYGDGATAANRFYVGETEAWYFTVKVVARQTNDDFSINRYRFEGVIARDTGGSAAIIGTTTASEDEEDAAWDCTLTTTGNYFNITVTGAAGENISWIASIDLVQLKG